MSQDCDCGNRCRSGTCVQACKVIQGLRRLLLSYGLSVSMARAQHQCRRTLNILGRGRTSSAGAAVVMAPTSDVNPAADAASPSDVHACIKPNIETRSLSRPHTAGRTACSCSLLCNWRLETFKSDIAPMLKATCMWMAIYRDHDGSQPCASHQTKSRTAVCSREKKAARPRPSSVTRTNRCIAAS